MGFTGDFRNEKKLEADLIMRWRAFFPALIVLAAVWVFGTFVMDGFVRRALEKAATAANGAKVEIDRVNIGLSGTSVGLYGIRVTDRERPMTNAFQAEAIEFDLAGKPLLWKRLIIEKGEIRGIRTGTERKTSGALKDEVFASEPGTLPEDSSGTAPPSPDVQESRDKADPDGLAPEDLSSYRKLVEETERLNVLADGWEKQADKIEVDSLIRAAKEWLEKIESANYSGAEGARRAAKDLKEGEKLTDGLNAAVRRIVDLKTALSNEASQARESLNDIDELKAQDLAQLTAKFGAVGLSAEGLAGQVVGPVWLARAKTVLGLIARIRAAIPLGEGEKDKPRPPSRAGRRIDFPFRHAWPALHLQEASLSGETEGLKAVSYTGVLRDVTSDPKLVGKPITLRAEGSRKDGASVRLQAELDYTGPRARESLYFRYAGMDLAGMKLGNLGGPVEILQGTGELISDLTAAGDGVGGKFAFIAAPIKFDYKLENEKSDDKLIGVIRGVLESQNRLEVTILVSGRIGSPDFKLRSSLENQLKGAVSETAKKELEALEGRYRARIDALVDDERAKLAEAVFERAGGAAEKLSAKEKALGDVQDRVTKAAEQVPSSGLKGLIKKR